MLGFLFRIGFRLFSILFVWRKHDKAKSSFNIEMLTGSWEGGRGEILCVCSGALKNRRGQGEGVKSGYWTKGLIEGLNGGGGGALVGCRLKFRYFVGSRLKFSIFVGSR